MTAQLPVAASATALVAGRYPHHQRSLHADLDPLHLRQLRAFPRRRRRHGQGRLRYLVLPYGRLYLWPRSRAGHGRRGEGGRRPRTRQRARSDQHLGFLIRAAPGASLKSQGDRSRQRRRGHQQLHQTSGRVRDRARRAENWSDCSSSSTTSTRLAWRWRKACC